jgi:hypothetical protein
MPGAGGGATQTSTLSHTQQLQVAKCMRSHGVPNFPDPNASGAPSPAALGKCLPGGGPVRVP